MATRRRETQVCELRAGKQGEMLTSRVVRVVADPEAGVHPRLRVANKMNEHKRKKQKYTYMSKNEKKLFRNFRERQREKEIER